MKKGKKKKKGRRLPSRLPRKSSQHMKRLKDWPLRVNQRKGITFRR